MRNQYKRAYLQAVGPERVYLAPPGWEIHTVLGMNYVGGGKADELSVILHQLITGKEARKTEAQ